jgi:hypothetical protein
MVEELYFDLGLIHRQSQIAYGSENKPKRLLFAALLRLSQYFLPLAFERWLVLKLPGIDGVTSRVKIYQLKRNL